MKRVLTGWLLLSLLCCLTLPLTTSAAGLLINGDRTLGGRMNYAVTAGTSTAYTLSITPAPTTWSLIDGLCFEFRAHTANTGSATLNVNSLGAKTLQKRVAGSLTNLVANDIGTNQLVMACYESTNNIMQVMSLGTASGSGTVTSITGSGPIVLTPSPLVATGTISFDSKQAGTLADGGTTDLTCGTSNQGKTQVMDSGEWQYCDGATTSVLRKGTPTQSGLTWNVTESTCTSDSNSGKITVNGSHQIICAPDNGGAGGSGDITDVGTCTTGACFTDTTTGARLTFGPIAAPSTPASGKATVYVDSTSKNFAVKDDAGLIKHGVQTVTQTSGQYLAAINDDGSATKVVPTKADVGLSNVDNTSDATKNSAAAILSNKQIVPRVSTCTPVSNVITPNADTMDQCEALALTAGVTIANPSHTGSNPVNGQTMEVVLMSAAPQTVAWGTDFDASCGMPLPTGTTGDGTTKNHFLLKYHASSTKWCLIGTTKAPALRVTTTTTSTTSPTFACNADTNEQCILQITSATGTITMAVPGGTPTEGQLLMMGFLCTNSQTISWPGGTFVASPNIPLTTTCPANTTQLTLVGLRYSTLISRWQGIASN